MMMIMTGYLQGSQSFNHGTSLLYVQLLCVYSILRETITKYMLMLLLLNTGLKVCV